MAKDPFTGQPVPWNDLHGQYIDGSVDGDLPMTRLSEMFNVNHFIVSQVNPHVVPFLPKDDGPNTATKQESYNIPRWLQTATLLAKDEALHRMTVLSELGVFPTSLTKLMSIVNQRYSGDINIYPEILYTHFPRMLKNPTTDFMLKACLCGERATWPKLSRSRNHCAIELALDSAIQTMRARVAFSPSHLGQRYTSLTHHSIDSFDSTGGRGRAQIRRRGSYSHEGEHFKRGRGNSLRRQAPDLKQIRQALSYEEPSRLKNRLDNSPISSRRNEGHQSSLPGADLDSHKETGVPSPERPGLPRHRATWGPCVEYTSSRPGHHERLPSRRSSVSSGGSQPFSAGTVHRRSSAVGDPNANYRLSSKTVSPPPHHLLRMTPTASDDFSNPSLQNGQL